MRGLKSGFGEIFLPNTDLLRGPTNLVFNRYHVSLPWGKGGRDVALTTIPFLAPGSSVG